MIKYNLARTEFNRATRDALSYLNHALRVSANNNELFKNVAPLKHIIQDLENLVNKKVKFDINLETKNVCECENNCVYFTGVYDTGGNPVCIEDIVDTKTSSKHKFGNQK